MASLEANKLSAAARIQIKSSPKVSGNHFSALFCRRKRWHLPGWDLTAPKSPLNVSQVRVRTRATAIQQQRAAGSGIREPRPVQAVCIPTFLFPPSASSHLCRGEGLAAARSSGPDSRQDGRAVGTAEERMEM